MNIIKIKDCITKLSVKMKIRLASYKNNFVKNNLLVDFPDDKIISRFNNTEFLFKISEKVLEEGISDISLETKVISGILSDCAAGLYFDLKKWSIANYVVMPAAVYCGNRFKYRNNSPYPPVPQKEDISLETEPVISGDMERLNNRKGLSRIHLISTDMSTPSVGIFFPELKHGIWILIPHTTKHGYPGIELEESPDRKNAILSIMLPGVRVHRKLEDKNTPDSPATLLSGDSIRLKIRICVFKCNNIPDLYKKFMELRKSFSNTNTNYCEIPFSAAWHIQEKK